MRSPGQGLDQSRNVPAFHGYRASGVAGGEVVYVNSGSPADHDRLRQLGVSVEGRIALVRYGGAFRGLKVKEAQVGGPSAYLIYLGPGRRRLHAR